jgi:single-stranded DNA-binding protein
VNNSTFSVTLRSDPELKHLDIGGRETTFVSSLVGLKDIKGVETAIRIEAWGKVANDISVDLCQGDEAILIGRLQIKARETEAGIRKSAELIVSQFFKIGGETVGATSDKPVTQWKQLDSMPTRKAKPPDEIVYAIDEVDPNSGDIDLDDIPF